jgi:hypothetical protein
MNFYKHSYNSRLEEGIEHYRLTDTEVAALLQKYGARPKRESEQAKKESSDEES